MLSTTNVIIGLAVGILLAGVIIMWRQRYRDVFGGLLVFGVLALAIVVTIVQVSRYREETAQATAEAQQPAVPESPPLGTAPRPPVSLPARLR